MWKAIIVVLPLLIKPSQDKLNKTRFLNKYNCMSTYEVREKEVKSISRNINMELQKLNVNKRKLDTAQLNLLNDIYIMSEEIFKLDYCIMKHSYKPGTN